MENAPEEAGAQSRLQMMQAIEAARARSGLILVTADGRTVAAVPQALIRDNAKRSHRPCNGTGLTGTLRDRKGNAAEYLCRCTYKRLIQLTEATLAAAELVAEADGQTPAAPEAPNEAPGTAAEATDGSLVHDRSQGPAGGPAAGPEHGPEGGPDQG